MLITYDFNHNFYAIFISDLNRDFYPIFIVDLNRDLNRFKSMI